MKRYVKSSTLDIPPNGGTILYRVGDIDTMSSNSCGVFFATKLSYFNYNEYLGYLAENAHKYLLSPQAKIWDPARDFQVFNIYSWSNIVCLMSDLDKYGIEDECDYEIEDEYGVTSTDGLALAGKKLGYDATVIHGVWYDNEQFDEYAVYNPTVIKPI